MASGVRQLYFRLGMDTSGLRSGASRANTVLRTMTKTVAIVGTAMIALGTKVSRMAMAYERTKLTFDAFTGSAEKSREMLRSIEKLAIKTPLESTDLNEAATMLMGMGIEGEKLIPTLEMLGDLARGDAQSFQQLALVYGQARAETKAMSKDLRQFINAGVPVLKLLADSMGVAENSIFDLAEQGKISFGELEKAFQKATSEGGMYFNFMARQATTASGLFSTLSDAFSIYLRRVGEYLLPTLKEAAGILIRALDGMNDSMDDAAANDAPIRMAAHFTAAFTEIQGIARVTARVIEGIFQVAIEGIGLLIQASGKAQQWIGGATNNPGMSAMGVGTAAAGEAIFNAAKKRISTLHMEIDIIKAWGKTYSENYKEAFDRIKAQEQALRDFDAAQRKASGGGDAGGGEKVKREKISLWDINRDPAKLSDLSKDLQDQIASVLDGVAMRTGIFGELGAGVMETLKENIASVTPVLDGLDKQLAAANAHMERMSAIANSIGEAFVSAFDQIIAGGFKFGEFMKEMFLGIIKQAIKALVITLALKVLSAGTDIGKMAFGDLFKSVLGGGLGLPKTAHGGITNGPQTRIVGEAGREAIIPLNRGSSRNMLGGGGAPQIVGVLRSDHIQLMSLIGQQNAIRKGTSTIQF